MTVKELVKALKGCHPEDQVTVSLTDGLRHTFAGVIEVDQITRERLGCITLIADTDEI